MKTRTAIVLAVGGIGLFMAIGINNRNVAPATPTPTPESWHVTGVIQNDTSPYVVRCDDGKLYLVRWTGGFSDWRRGFLVTLTKREMPLVKNEPIAYRESMFAATNAFQDSDVVISEVQAEPGARKKLKR